MKIRERKSRSLKTFRSKEADGGEFETPLRNLNEVLTVYENPTKSKEIG